jgi:hypothetical protein
LGPYFSSLAFTSVIVNPDSVECKREKTSSLVLVQILITAGNGSNLRKIRRKALNALYRLKCISKDTNLTNGASGREMCTPLKKTFGYFGKKCAKSFFMPKNVYTFREIFRDRVDDLKPVSNTIETN